MSERETYLCKGCHAPLDIYTMRCWFCGRYHPDLAPLTVMGPGPYAPVGSITPMSASTCAWVPTGYGYDPMAETLPHYLSRLAGLV